MQATETSTGARHCLGGVAKLLREANSEALLVVDAITGLGTTHIDMDASASTSSSADRRRPS